MDAAAWGAAWGVIVAALVAGLVSAVVAYATMKRDDDVRAKEQKRSDDIRAEDQKRADKTRADDQEHASKELQAALDRQEASTRAAWDFERGKIREDEGRAAARFLLTRLRVIRDSFDLQSPDMWGYSVDRAKRNDVEDASLLIPDSSLRRYVVNAMEAIDHLSYAVEHATYILEAGVSVPSVQRKVLLDLMREVGSYGASNAWNEESSTLAASIGDAIDNAYRQVLAEEEWQREQGLG
ncbi:hypothetical protein FVP74_08345 [Microbacterium saccharophilum]|uniref:Uncharacterized protein n=1 Tax=Microbacterium saccharophilum TaxID=1213358 RepID=A0A5C8HY49_9MICO|nr:hypothetical protein [Microbacterium saccharophilum]TXK11341.1 hypothetical protein FVP74_08345 [Microbacterium saccharophilum]GEP48796.1 hypothetical protein MSA03_23040 [Microbacterium saccharophilum]